MKNQTTIKFLGTSSGRPIPRDGCECPQCLSTSKRDKRLRSSILVGQKILVDASPDILQQLKQSEIEQLDSVIITHEHDDHIGGIRYLLKKIRDVRIIRMRPGQHFKIFGIEFFGFKVEHSKFTPTVGILINDTAYIPDSSSLNLATKYLKEVKTAILDGSVLDRSFGGHMPINEIIQTVKANQNLKTIYFTHNGHIGKSHAELTEIIQKLGDKRFHLAFDGLEITG